MSHRYYGNLNHNSQQQQGTTSNVDHQQQPYLVSNRTTATPTTSTNPSPFASLLNYKSSSLSTSLISDRLNKLSNNNNTTTPSSALSYTPIKSFKSMINTTTSNNNTNSNRLPLSTITSTNGASTGYLFTNGDSELIKSNKRKRLVNETSINTNNTNTNNNLLDNSSITTSKLNTTINGGNNNLNNSSITQHLFTNQEYQQINEKNQQLEEQVRKLKIDLQNVEMDKDEFKRLHEEAKKIIKENEDKCESLKNRNQFLQSQVQKLSKSATTTTTTLTIPPNTTSNQNSSTSTMNNNNSGISIDVNPHLLSKTVQYQTHIENTNVKISNLLKQTVITMNNMDNTIQNTNRDYISLFVQGCVDRVIHSHNEKQLDSMKEQVTPIIEIDIPMYQQTISHLNVKLQDMETRYKELLEFHQIELNVLQSQYQQLQLKHQRDMKELMTIYKKENHNTFNNNANNTTTTTNNGNNDKLIQIAKIEYQNLQKEYQDLEFKYQEDISKYCKEIEDLNSNIQQYQHLILQYDENINHLRCKYEQIQTESIEQLKRLRLTRQDYFNQLNQIKNVNSSLQEQVNNFKIQIEKSQIESWTLYNTNKHLTLRLDYLLNNEQDVLKDSNIKSEIELIEMKYNNIVKSYNLLKNEYQHVIKTSQQTLLRYDDLLNRCKLDRSFYQEFIQYEILPYLEVASLDPTNERQYKSLLVFLIRSINKNILITDQYHYNDNNNNSNNTDTINNNHVDNSNDINEDHDFQSNEQLIRNESSTQVCDDEMKED